MHRTWLINPRKPRATFFCSGLVWWTGKWRSFIGGRSPSFPYPSNQLLGFVWIKIDWSGLRCILEIETEISSYYTPIHLISSQFTPIQDYPNKPLGAVRETAPGKRRRTSNGWIVENGGAGASLSPGQLTYLVARHLGPTAQSMTFFLAQT